MVCSVLRGFACTCDVLCASVCHIAKCFVLKPARRCVTLSAAAGWMGDREWYDCAGSWSVNAMKLRVNLNVALNS